MIKLESFYHVHEAQLVVDELELEHIPAFVSSERRGAAGALPFTQAYCEVWIDSDKDETRGREVLKRIAKARRDKGHPDVTCQQCGTENPSHYAMCWKCGKAISTGAEGAGQTASDDGSELGVRATTRRVLSPERSTGVRIAWIAAGLLPALLLFLQGAEGVALMTFLLTAFVLWLLSGVHAADYCANCHASLAHGPAACPDCGRVVQGDVEEKKFVAGGGRALTGGMMNAITVLCAILVVALACVFALASMDSPRGPTRRVNVVPSKPF